MNFRHIDGDGDSSGSSSSWPEDITEEEAMQIWLRRDAELEEARLLRERQTRHEQFPPRHDGQSPPPPGELVARRRHDDSDPYSSAFGSSGGSSSSSEGRPLEIPAARSRSAAWRAALAYNPVDPADRDAHAAYQRFMEINRPGMADAYVASTPGLAQLLEQQRAEDRRRREEEERRRDGLAECMRIEERQRRAFEEARQRRIRIENDYYGASHSGGDPAPRGPTSDPQGSTSGPKDAALAAQLREYERLSQAHRVQNNHRQNNDHSRPIGFAAPTRNGSAAGPNANGSEKKKGWNPPIGGYYLATPERTEYLTKPVICYRCPRTVFTHPLAQNFSCHICGHVSIVDQDVGKMCEEKMADKEDWGQDASMS